MKNVYIILFMIIFAFLLTGAQLGTPQIETLKGNTPMDTQTFISIFNFSKTLIQDAEIKFLWYVNTPTHPDDVGKGLQNFIQHRKQEYRDAPQKTSDPEALQRAILEDIERAKTYRPFRDSNQDFLFKEGNLVFQRLPDSREQNPQFNYRMEMISCFDTFPSIDTVPFPSVDFARYYAGGRQEHFAVNPRQKLDGVLPDQFDNERSIGNVEERPIEDMDFWMISFPFSLPPATLSSDKANVQIESAEVDGEDVFIITHSPHEGVLTKIYVHPTDIPQVFREEHYYKSESPNANEDGYWLRLVEEYRDFVPIETLGITYPKIFESKEYRPDGFMCRNEIITIIEMAFNQGLPSNFFDWNLQEYRNTSEEAEAP